MYGLLRSAYDQYLINNNTDQKIQYKGYEGFKGQVKHSASLIFFVAIAMFIYIFTILCLFDIWIVMNLNGWFIASLLLLLFTPVIGDLLSICIIIYWVMNVKSKSQMINRFH